MISGPLGIVQNLLGGILGGNGLFGGLLGGNGGLFGWLPSGRSRMNHRPTPAGGPARSRGAAGVSALDPPPQGGEELRGVDPSRARWSHARQRFAMGLIAIASPPEAFVTTTVRLTIASRSRIPTWGTLITGVAAIAP